MPRIARIIAPHYPHHVTQRSNNRVDVFLDDEDKAKYLSLLKDYNERLAVDVWAYCLMTNHVHILAVPARNVSLSRCIGRTNLLYTQHVNRKYNRSGRLWQNRFFSTIIDTESSYLWAVARYIEQNPVKSALVTRPDETISGRVAEPILGDKETDWLQVKGGLMKKIGKPTGHS
ncbi:putative transposase [Syntrophus gentianae]|uniref:Putative transposase n=1 Tax=Syntrophus gentianae TaxID=43775 RepID=A0A1H7WNT8_9BACT|nr:transposase [Syntrophus gentianae]SEM22795.1 putative transposase [Syntrophus gentianae]